MLHITFGDVVQLALRIDGAGIDVPEQDFEHENRARHFLYGADIQLGRDFLRTGSEITHFRIIKSVVERAFRRVKNGTFRLFQIQRAGGCKVLC